MGHDNRDDAERSSAPVSSPQDLEFDLKLRARAPQAPSAPANEWASILARIQAGESPESIWDALLSLVRSFDFWMPVVSFAILAIVMTTVVPANIPTNLPAWMGGDTTVASLNQVSEFFSTDLNPKTVTVESAFVNY